MTGRVLLAGTNSGCGKTTVTLSLLSALCGQNLPVRAFKCGPDYIDPMFHRKAVGVASENLDPYFSTGEQLRGQLARAGGLAVIEGVMGYYDGIGPEGRASTYDVARQTETPVILVVNAKGMYTSAGAILQGFQNFRPDSGICGVIFNGVSAMVYHGLREIAAQAGVRPLGYLPSRPDLAIESRHLGLVTADEITDIKEKLTALGRLAEETLDLPGILDLAGQARPLAAPKAPPAPSTRVPVAVARDRAFCFLYEENLRLLEDLGCALRFFSPLTDPALPEGVGGLYLPGGYPELYAEALSQNRPMLAAVGEAIARGMPTIAECGGFLYLHETLDGWPMVGAVAGAAFRTEKLQRFGYAQLTAQTDSLLCRTGETLRVHEFHYYDSTDNGTAFRAEKPSGRRNWLCGHGTEALYAGFPHLYFPADPTPAQRFIHQAAVYLQR